MGEQGERRNVGFALRTGSRSGSRSEPYITLSECRGDGGEFLMGQLAGVIDADGAAIGVDFSDRVGLGVGGREKRGVQRFPHRHDLRISLISALPRASGKLIGAVEKRVRREE